MSELRYWRVRVDCEYAHETLAVDRWLSKTEFVVQANNSESAEVAGRKAAEDSAPMGYPWRAFTVREVSSCVLPLPVKWSRPRLIKVIGGKRCR